MAEHEQGAGAGRGPIGVFDSGVGGLSVLREIRTLLPGENVVYAADSGYVPYGSRSPAFIRRRALAITRYLRAREAARVVVVACNTATTHAVDALRGTFPDLSIVGMEPAVKPATLATRSGVVGVLATGATLGGERFARLVRRFAEDVEVLTQPCPGLVEQVEAGDLSGPRTVALLRQYTAPMLARGADTIVLGCTHYPFLRETLQRLVGPTVALIDTGAAVARQTARVLAARGALGGPADSAGPGTVRFSTSGDPSTVQPVVERLWGEPVPRVERLPV